MFICWMCSKETGNTKQYNPTIENPYGKYHCSRCGVCAIDLYKADATEERIIKSDKESYFNRYDKYD